MHKFIANASITSLSDFVLVMVQMSRENSFFNRNEFVAVEQCCWNQLDTTLTEFIKINRTNANFTLI